MIPIPVVARARYQFNDYNQLCDRVGNAVDRGNKINLAELMRRRVFLPAGNTLLAGHAPIRPNCSIMPALTDANYDECAARAETLWAAVIGIGWRFDGLSKPAAALRDLSARHARIQLGFRSQRGNMGVISIEHPALREFIAAKDASVYNFNISVAITNNFMHRLAAGCAEARTLLRQCARSAHVGGDPGVVFIDRVQSDTPTPFGRIETLVPCGEQGMFADETCNLGSINLAACDFDTPSSFEDVVQRGVQALDNVVDLLDIPDERMLARTRALRRIGLGIMGFAALLEAKGIAYDSARAVALVRDIGTRFRRAALHATQTLARTRGGLQFDNTRRNITTTCIAPTGGIALLTGHRSFGIEPLFGQATTLTPGAHLDIQATWQRCVENSVSKTVNMPEECTVRHIEDVFIGAWRRGCKSVTVYRNNSRNGQPIECGIAKSDDGK